MGPNLDVTDDRIRGCVPLWLRTVTLFSFDRCVEVNRGLRRVTVQTQHLWLWRRSRTVSFDQVTRIVYRATLMPGFTQQFFDGEWAVFFIGLALQGTHDELQLFSVWESQPQAPDALDALRGVRKGIRVGDEEGARIVTLLREYLGVPIAPN